MPKARRTALRYQHQPTPGKTNTRGHNQSLNHHLTRRPKVDKGQAPMLRQQASYDQTPMRKTTTLGLATLLGSTTKTTETNTTQASKTVTKTEQPSLELATKATKRKQAPPREQIKDHNKQTFNDDRITKWHERSIYSRAIKRPRW